MMDEFRSGQVSIPAGDADEVPSCCFDCPFLSYKEFSVDAGAFYYYCAYHWADRAGKDPPPCQEGDGPPRSG